MTRQGILIPHLVTARLVVRLAHLPDAPALLSFWRENGDRYDPPLPAEFLSEECWAERTLRNHRDCLEDRRYSMCVFEGFRMVGTVALNDVQRGFRHAASLGYGIAGSHEGQGYMFEAVVAVVDWAFGELNLHRLEADHDPENVRSAQLLKRLGFEREGRARKRHYNGHDWRDSVQTSKLNPAWRSTP